MHPPMGDLAHEPALVLRRIAKRAGVLLHPRDPWFAQDAVRFCKAHLTSDMVGLEWGSGRGTVWFARRLRELTSVEHDREWYDRVVRGLSRKGLNHATCLCVPLDHDPSEPTRPLYDPLPRYVAVAQNFVDGSLDFVVVDGHYRQACIRAALPKLKSGGLLLVDNTNWLPRAAWGIPEDWQVVHRSSNIMRDETTLWRKP
jgi:predicted O-methyltransferase YrrM